MEEIQTTQGAPPGTDASATPAPDTAALVSTPVEETSDTAPFAEAFRAHAEARHADLKTEASTEEAKADGDAAKPDVQPVDGRTRDDKGRFVKADAQPAAEAAPVAEPEKPAETALSDEERYQQFVSRYEREQTEKSEREQREAQARQQEADDLAEFSGKPGELAALLLKEAEQGWLYSDENERKLTLIRNNRIAAPFEKKIRAEVEVLLRADADRRVEEAQQETTRLIGIWGDQFKAVADLKLEGFDGTAAVQTHQTLPALVEAAYRARDGEVEDLKAQLAEARGNAFRSQPGLVTAGGESPGSGGRPGLGPNASPSESMAYAFEQAGRQNGRR